MPINFFADPMNIIMFSQCKLFCLISGYAFDVNLFGICRDPLIATFAPFLILLAFIRRDGKLLSSGTTHLFGLIIFAVVKKKAAEV